MSRVVPKRCLLGPVPELGSPGPHTVVQGRVSLGQDRGIWRAAAHGSPVAGRAEGAGCGGGGDDELVAELGLFLASIMLLTAFLSTSFFFFKFVCSEVQFCSY